MPQHVNNGRRFLSALEKCPTGVKGVDEISGGGLPKGHRTLRVPSGRVDGKAEAARG